MAKTNKTHGKLLDPVRTMKRAIKFVGTGPSKMVLTSVHLDQTGDVVSTDSHRLYVEWHAWSGPSANIDYATAYDIAHCKVKGNDVAEFEFDGDKVTVRMGDGTEIAGALQHGNYPKYQQLVEGFETYAMARFDPKQLLPIAREHVKLKDDVRLGVKDGAFTADGTEHEPSAKFDGCGDGESFAGINAKYLRDALGIFGRECTVRIMNPLKPVTFTDDENVRLLVMPVRLFDAEPRKKEETVSKQAKKEEHMEKVNREGLAELLYALAIDRAAKEPDNKLTEGNASPNSATYVWRLEKDGRLGHEDFGSYTSWYLDGEFVTCIERRYSQRKIHLHYPEIKPVSHKEDKVHERRVEQAAKEKAGAEVEVEVTEHADVTAVTIEPKKLTPPPVKAEKKQKRKAPKAPAKPEEKGNDMEKRIEELEAKLKAMSAELEEVWKENAQLKAKPEPKPEPKPDPAEVKAEVVSLETMQQWCEGKGLVASQKREGTCIWVEGDSKEYADELKELGFRFAKKRKSWYLNPAA